MLGGGFFEEDCAASPRLGRRGKKKRLQGETSGTASEIPQENSGFYCRHSFFPTGTTLALLDPFKSHRWPTPEPQPPPVLHSHRPPPALSCTHPTIFSCFISTTARFVYCPCAALNEKFLPLLGFLARRSRKVTVAKGRDLSVASGPWGDLAAANKGSLVISTVRGRAGWNVRKPRRH